MADWNRIARTAGWSLMGCGVLAFIASAALQIADPALEDLSLTVGVLSFPVMGVGMIFAWFGDEKTHRILCGEWLHCPKCNYDLSGHAADSRRRLHCPECGDDFGVEYIQEYWKERYLGPRNPEE